MRHTPFLIAALAAVAVAAPAMAQGTPSLAPSGRGTTEVVVTWTDSARAAVGEPAVIRIDFGQPHLRGRTLHSDSLVPFDKPWRLGANAATTLVTEVDLVIGGQDVPKGTYYLQALPAQSGWTLFIQRTAGRTPMAAAMAYDPANDVARVPLRSLPLAEPIESLTFWLVPSTQPGKPRGELRFGWGRAMLSAEWVMK
jgi:hypothetical protein